MTSSSSRARLSCLGSAAWQSIVDPMLAAQGVDITKVTYVEAGWPTWGTALAAGQGDAALSWEGLRAEWIATGLEFEYWLGVQNSPLPANTFVVRAADVDDPDKRPSSRSTCAAGRWGWSSPTTIRAPRFRRCSSSSRRSPPTSGRSSARRRSCSRRTSSAATCPSATAGAGHDMASWQTFFDLIRRARPDHEADEGRGRLHQRAASGRANDFDHDKVKADAEAVRAGRRACAAVDVEAIRAQLFDQADPGLIGRDHERAAPPRPPSQ